MYSYSCYGLRIHSALPLPELEQGAGSGEQGVREQGAKRKAQRAKGKEQSAKSEAQKPIRNPQSAMRNVSSDLRLERAGSKELGAWSMGQRAGKAETRTDVEIRFGRVDRLPSGVGAEGSFFRTTLNKTQLFWDNVVTIQVRAGREITIDPVPGAQENRLRHLVLGPALAALLQQRGLLVLHASAVAIDDGAVAFLGGKGWGKSTLAGALYSRGYGIAADDVTAVHVGRGSPTVVPAFPQLKLWPDTAIALGRVAEELPELYSGAVKLAQRADHGFPQTPLPLKCIYVIAEGKTKQIKPLGPGKAFLELVRHSYWAELLQASGASTHFLQCAKVSKSTAARNLRMPRSLVQLPDVVRMVEKDITSYDIYRNRSSPAA